MSIVEKSLSLVLYFRWINASNLVLTWMHGGPMFNFYWLFSLVFDNSVFFAAANLVTKLDANTHRPPLITIRLNPVCERMRMSNFCWYRRWFKWIVCLGRVIFCGIWTLNASKAVTINIGNFVCIFSTSHFVCTYEWVPISPSNSSVSHYSAQKLSIIWPPDSVNHIDDSENHFLRQFLQHKHTHILCCDGTRSTVTCSTYYKQFIFLIYFNPILQYARASGDRQNCNNKNSILSEDGVVFFTANVLYAQHCYNSMVRYLHYTTRSNRNPIRTVCES